MGQDEPGHTKQETALNGLCLIANPDPTQPNPFKETLVRDGLIFTRADLSAAA